MSQTDVFLGRVLVVEDEPDLAVLIQRHLSAIPVTVEWASDGETGLQRALSEAWDAVVLDVRLPRCDGLTVCQKVRGHNPGLPILMLTALGSEIDRVLGLEMGADDYLTKPFSVVELQARVRALIRRGRLLQSAISTTRDIGQDRDENSQSMTVQVGGLCIDKNRHRAWLDAVELCLTRREFDLLWQFASYPGQVFSRSELLVSVWGRSHEGYDHTVNSHINRLRGKFKELNQVSISIETVWGVGYRLKVQQ
ncbi:MAG: response regulator transcription factor [Burkholderiaceae bacterium]